MSSKAVLARELGVSRSSLYYQPKKPDKDWQTKCAIELALRENPSYGHKRLASHLKMNKKKVRRVMRIYGIKPYRRHGRKWKQTKHISTVYPNLLLTEHPAYQNHIWASDFTYLGFKSRTVYVATVIDLFTKKVVGFSVLTNHSVQLTINALLTALNSNSRPVIFHSDNGKEYDAKDFKAILQTLDIRISRSKKGCPWENGYQESFYDKFKVELGDPSRFGSLGELVFGIYETIRYYNYRRIHSVLKMPPVEFALRHQIQLIS